MCNRAIGVVEDVLFPHDRLPPCLPIPSGVRSLQNVVLQPISFQRLESIGKSKRLQERLQEEGRLRNLAEVTVVRYQHL